METDKANQLIVIYGNKFPNHSLYSLRDQLETMDYGEAAIRLAQTKDPILSLVLSLFLGYFGIDRFYIGDTLLGALKLITCGGLGFWAFIDLFLIIGATKERNYSRFEEI